MTRDFTLDVNGRSVTVTAEEDTPLLTALREQLDLKGSRFGCGLGLCGACFVLLDGQVVASCDTPMWAAHGHTVVTVEGLGTDEDPHPVQRALLERQAAQCGFCTSGIVVSAAALLQRTPRPTREEVEEALDRNLCRCGVQRRVVQAVVDASAARP
ncbi:MAG TPA: (2Fe-2S)-binding protein [Nocardioides sp.]|nr:(2Fe-2S)-binding protein [Nocardioides sp.]